MIDRIKQTKHPPTAPVSYGMKEEVHRMLQEKERVVVITRYKAIYPTEVNVWLREAWDNLVVYAHCACE